MAIDRSKFTKTSVAQMQSADKEFNKSLGKKEKISSNGHELEEGSNLLRIYPVHPDVAAKDPKAQFSVPFAQTFLPAIVVEKDKQGVELKDAKGNLKTKESVKPVYSALIHGFDKTIVKKDLVDEYIKLATKWAKDNFKTDAERKSFCEPIYGNFAKQINGITYPAKWVVYADMYPGGNPDATPVFDRFFFKKSIKDRLNVISQMETKGDPLGTDPFTDVDEGRTISIFVNKDGGATGYYTTELDNTTTNELLANGKTAKVAKSFPLTDSQLEVFFASKTLQDMYSTVAGRKNFETQLAGLEMFDAKHGLGIFSLTEWDAIVIECDGYYPEEDPNAPAATDATNDHTDAPEDLSSDEFDLLNRQELQAFAKENKTGVLVKPGLSDDGIRNLLRKWQEAAHIEHKPLPGEEGYVELEAEEPLAEDIKVDDDKFLAEMNAPVTQTTEKVEEVKQDAPAATGQTAAEKLKAMRAKMAVKASA